MTDISRFAPDLHKTDLQEAGLGGVETCSTGRPPSVEPTGDAAVDEALERLAVAGSEPLDTQIEAGRRVHSMLQSRLCDLAKE